MAIKTRLIAEDMKLIVVDKLGSAMKVMLLNTYMPEEAVALLFPDIVTALSIE